MASRHLTPALSVIVILCVATVPPIVALFLATSAQEFTIWRDHYMLSVIRFSFLQATLSTVLSVALAVPIARALARQTRLFGRSLLVQILGVPVVVPVVVAVFGIVSVFGQAGWVNQAALLIGLPPGQYLYGLTGILIAHVFFNMPLAVRLLLPQWDAIPGETWRLATQLGLGSRSIFRMIEWPLLRQSLPGIAGLVFMLCFTSFAVVLTLGGGPAATTIEVAIFQALRFDFDLPRAAILAVLQTTFCITILFFLYRIARPVPPPLPGEDRYRRPDSRLTSVVLLDAALILIGIGVVLLPLSAVVYDGLSGPIVRVLSNPKVWQATLLSATIAGSASVLSFLAAWGLISTSRRYRFTRPRFADLIELSGVITLVISPIVLGTGYFILLRPFADVFSLAVPLVILANAMMGLPYIIRTLGPLATSVHAQYDQLATSLGMSTWSRFRWIEWPCLRRPISMGLALTASLSIGDLGVIALFGSQQYTTLPYLLYQLLSAYRMGDAAVVALLLIGLSLLMFILVERCIGGWRRA